MLSPKQQTPNDEILKKIKPEIIFCHLSSYEIYSETFATIRSICSPIIVNWCSDDSWRYEQHSALIAKSFDLMITTYKDAHKNNFNNKINSILSNFVIIIFSYKSIL